MDPAKARAIADRLFAKWVADPKNDGAYTLKLNFEETEGFFADIVRELILAGRD